MEILLARGARTILWGVKTKEATLLKASFQRVDLFILVELRSPVKPGMTYDCWGSPVKPGMTCGTDMTVLLSDAEIPEDVSQYFVCGDFSDDAADMVYCFTDILSG